MKRTLSLALMLAVILGGCKTPMGGLGFWNKQTPVAVSSSAAPAAAPWTTAAAPQSAGDVRLVSGEEAIPLQGETLHVGDELPAPQFEQLPPQQHVPQTLPREAFTGPPSFMAVPPPGYVPPHLAAPEAHQHHQGQPCPCCGPKAPFKFSEDMGPMWHPDGIALPWPSDEYLCDGGDLNDDVRIRARDRLVAGLDQEDTVVHYDTRDGKTEVSRSNRVCIYAPRFASVRKVTSPVLHEAHERMAGLDQPEKVNLHLERTPVNTATQPLEPASQLALDPVIIYNDRTKGLLVENNQSLLLAERGFMPHEDLLFIQRGVFEATEKARLAERTQAAIAWSSDQAVQLIIDGKLASEDVGVSKAQETVVYELHGTPRMRICKIASRSEAQVGETVDFTLRFDNVGDQRVEKVVIVDNLTTRLEFVEGSASCTVPAKFLTEPNDGESLVLRWEIEQPLEVNQGGIIRFQCRVR